MLCARLRQRGARAPLRRLLAEITGALTLALNPTLPPTPTPTPTLTLTLALTLALALTLTLTLTLALPRYAFLTFILLTGCFFWAYVSP